MNATFNAARGMRGVLICLGLLTLGACASGAAPDKMTIAIGSVPPVAAGQPGYHELKVGNVQGGSDTNPLWESNVSNDDFRSALQTSLHGVGYLSDDPAKANLEVTASLIDLQRPIAGIDMTVTSKVRYTVAPNGGGAPVFDQTIAASGTGKFGDALLGVERLRLANEASIQANITAFLQQLQDALKAKP